MTRSALRARARRGEAAVRGPLVQRGARAVCRHRRARSGGRRGPHADGARDRFPAGAFAPLRRSRPATTRWRTTTDSIWPHDNAIVAAGFARYGFRDEPIAVLEAMFEASLSMNLYRLPELFCGFAREPGEGPISYPVACAPQAWASASVFLLLQSVLGLEIKAGRRLVQFTRPKLPEFFARSGFATCGSGRTPSIWSWCGTTVTSESTSLKRLAALKS